MLSFHFVDYSAEGSGRLRSASDGLKHFFLFFKKNICTSDFIRNNPEFVENQTTVGEIVCNKDTGGLKAFHSWSRWLFFIVSAGGHIEYWQPLYRYSDSYYKLITCFKPGLVCKLTFKQLPP